MSRTGRVWVRSEHESLLGAERVRRGLTYKDLAKLTGESPQWLAQLSTGLVPPVYLGQRTANKGQLKPSVEKVCLILEIDPVKAFPAYFCALPVACHDYGLTDSQLCAATLFSEGTAEALTCSAEHAAEWREYAGKVYAWLETRRPIYAIVFESRMEGDTLDEIGQRHDVTRERVRQIEAEIINKLRSIRR